MTKIQKQSTTPSKQGGKPPVTELTRIVEESTARELVVFAFRLTPGERETIHRAAGPAGASRFVRSIAVAAAMGDEEAVLKLLGGPAPKAT